MLQRYRTSTRLFSDFNTLQFASVMAMVVFVILIMFMMVPTVHQESALTFPTFRTLSRCRARFGRM